MSANAPLAGRRVALTRAAGQNDQLRDLLHGFGAAAVEIPTIVLQASDDPCILEVLQQLHSFDWVIFTSANGVHFALEQLRRAGVERRALSRCRLAAVGPATAQRLAAAGLAVELTPDAHLAEGLLAAIGEVRGRRILLPTVDIARDFLADGLTERGAEVTRLTVYCNRPAPPPPDLAARVADLDAVTFTSSSTVRNFVAMLPNRDPLAACTIACIGPATAATAEESGLHVAVMPTTYTVPALAEALCRHFSPE